MKMWLNLGRDQRRIEGLIEVESGIISDARGWRNTGMEAENSGFVRMRLVWTKGKNLRWAQTWALQNIGSIQRFQPVTNWIPKGSSE